MFLVSKPQVADSKRVSPASQSPIAYNEAGSGQDFTVALADRDSITGILARLVGNPEGVQVNGCKRYGSRISQGKLDVLYRSLVDNTLWVLHTSLTL